MSAALDLLQQQEDSTLCADLSAMMYDLALCQQGLDIVCNNNSVRVLVNLSNHTHEPTRACCMRLLGLVMARGGVDRIITAGGEEAVCVIGMLAATLSTEVPTVNKARVAVGNLGPMPPATQAGRYGETNAQAESWTAVEEHGTTAFAMHEAVPIAAAAAAAAPLAQALPSATYAQGVADATPIAAAVILQPNLPNTQYAPPPSQPQQQQLPASVTRAPHAPESAPQRHPPPNTQVQQQLQQQLQHTHYAQSHTTPSAAALTPVAQQQQQQQQQQAGGTQPLHTPPPAALAHHAQPPPPQIAPLSPSPVERHAAAAPAAAMLALMPRGEAAAAETSKVETKDKEAGELMQVAHAHALYGGFSFDGF